MSFNIVVGMKFQDVKQRHFLITDVYYICEEEGYLNFALSTVDGYNIHLNGPSEISSLKKIGFKELNRKDPTLIIRTVDYIYDLEKKKQIKFY